MNLKNLALFALAALLFSSCGGDAKKEEATPTARKERAARKPAEKKETKKTEAKASITIDLNDKGIGPIKTLTLETIDAALVEKGKEVYRSKCTACHKTKKRYIGPEMKGVTKRRSPEWIMNMMLNPEEMLAKNPTAKALLKEYSAPMANQNLTTDEARAILEFLRQLN